MLHLCKRVVGISATLIFAFVFLYLVISICILAFKLTGVLSSGVMYLDLPTPSYSNLLLFQGVCSLILLVCFFVIRQCRVSTGLQAGGNDA